jgi:hypothetical protein
MPQLHSYSVISQVFMEPLWFLAVRVTEQLRGSNRAKYFSTTSLVRSIDVFSDVYFFVCSMTI